MLLSMVFPIPSFNSNSHSVNTNRFGCSFRNHSLTPIVCNAKSQLSKSGTPRSVTLGPGKSKKKALRESPDMIFRVNLDQCSKKGDLNEALRLYNQAKRSNIKLNVYHYNILLYLCCMNNDGSGDDRVDFVRLEKGFEIFKQMSIDNVEPNEATFTNVSRLAAAKEDPEMAFSLVKKMKEHGINPKLRSYGPALFGFCKKGMADEAYEVDSHMLENEVLAEELELSALLKVSSEVKRDDKVYEIMHRLRATVRQVAEETAVIFEDWFRSKRAADVGMGLIW